MNLKQNNGLVTFMTYGHVDLDSPPECGDVVRLEVTDGDANFELHVAITSNEGQFEGRIIRSTERPDVAPPQRQRGSSIKFDQSNIFDLDRISQRNINSKDKIS